MRLNEDCIQLEYVKSFKHYLGNYLEFGEFYHSEMKRMNVSELILS